MTQVHTVLIVDDDDGIRHILASWVRRLGHQALLAASAEQALTLLDSQPVDLALCDVRMPGADGIWLVDRMRERHAGVPVVLASGVRELDSSFTLRAGVVAYVVKPFDRDEVLFAITTGLAWRANQMESPNRFFVPVCGPQPLR